MRTLIYLILLIFCVSGCNRGAADVQIQPSPNINESITAESTSTAVNGQNQIRNHTIDNVFAKRALQWKRPPAQVSQGYTYADDADLLIFYKSGDFAIISGTLNKYSATNHYSFCVGCGYSIRRGVWKLEENTIHVDYKVQYTSVHIVESSPADSSRSLDLKLTGNLQDSGATITIPALSKKRSDVHASDVPSPGDYITLENLSNIRDVLNAVDVSEEN